jgi:hypothetical protein
MGSGFRSVHHVPALVHNPFDTGRYPPVSAPMRGPGASGAGRRFGAADRVRLSYGYETAEQGRERPDPAPGEMSVLRSSAASLPHTRTRCARGPRRAGRVAPSALGRTPLDVNDATLATHIRQ